MSWKRDAASGLVVIVPLLVIAFVLSWLSSRVAGLPLVRSITVETTPIPPAYAELIPVVRVLVALVVFALLVLSVGYLMRTTVGEVVEGAIDGLFNRVPVLRVVYNASKLAVETAVTGTDELQAPVRVEMWNEARVTAFKTGKVTDDGRLVLFMPTAPNITTGFVVEVAPENVIETDETVEEALTRILSAGFAEDDRDVDDVLDEVDFDIANGSSSTDD
jgi:uncharacterized membrane protein